MSKMPFASKSPKGKGSNGHDATGAMTTSHIQKKPQSGAGLNAGNHPTNYTNDKGGSAKPSQLKRTLMKMNGLTMKDLGK